MGHGRSEDYWSFETIIVISKAMQDQFQVDWLAHYSILEFSWNWKTDTNGTWRIRRIQGTQYDRT